MNSVVWVVFNLVYYIIEYMCGIYNVFCILFKENEIKICEFLLV